jgi:hypothetical protein
MKADYINIRPESSEKQLFPTGFCGLPCNLLPPLRRHAFSPRRAAPFAKRLRSLVFAIVRDGVFDFACQNFHDMDGVANDIGGVDDGSRAGLAVIRCHALRRALSIIPVSDADLGASVQ